MTSAAILNNPSVEHSSDGQRQILVLLSQRASQELDQETDLTIQDIKTVLKLSLNFVMDDAIMEQLSALPLTAWPLRMQACILNKNRTEQSLAPDVPFLLFF